MDSLYSILFAFLLPLSVQAAPFEGPSQPGELLRWTESSPQVEKDHRGLREVKLSPKIHREPLTETIPSVPLDAIQPFLTRPRLMRLAELEDAPRVIGFAQEHIAGGVGDPFYVTGLEDLDPTIRKFELVHIGSPYRDPDTGTLLGHEATYVGDAEFLHSGEPAKLIMTASQREVQLDDRVLPVLEDRPLENFVPAPAPFMVEGTIISVLNGVNQIGLYNVVVLNKGQDDGLEPGHLLRIFQRADPPRALRPGGVWVRPPELPAEEVGVLMVFRTFERVSYALVMEAVGAIHVGDSVRSPDT